MAEITAAMVKELRIKTDAGMMDCKKALVECDGNMDEAVKYLREKGIAKAAKKADREAKEGIVATIVEGKDGIIYEINCETDFCSKGDKFQALAAEIGAALKASSATTLEDALNVAINGTTVEKYIAEQCAVIGENMKLRKFGRYTLAGEGTIASYIHMGGKVGVLVEISTEAGDHEAVKELAHDICLQIAAAKPEAVRREEVNSENLEKEREIYRAKALESGKPEKIVDKIVEGQIEKYYKEVCLLEQVFVKDGDKTIKGVVAETAKAVGSPIDVIRYARFERGEGIEKRKDNLAEEIAKMAQ